MAVAILEDVAKKSQVSTATASRVLNGVDSPIMVTDETKRRIFNAARELNYRPNVLARSFRTQKSNTLGVVMTHLVDPYCATIIHGIDQAANARGYRLVLSVIHDKPEPLNTCREMLGQKNVDGVIVVGSSLKLDDRSVMQLGKEGMKIALVGREIRNSSLPSVLVDNGNCSITCGR